MTSVNENAGESAPAVKGEETPARPADPLDAIVWHTDGIDAAIYEDRCDIATRHIIAEELHGIFEAVTALKTASVEAEPKATPAGRSASLAPEGTRGPTTSERIENAYREGWLDGAHQGQPEATSLLDRDWRRSVAREVAERLTPQADQGASGMSVPPPTTSGSPS